MKLFSCGVCGHTLYFQNVECTQCGHRLGFVPQQLDLRAFDIDEQGTWVPSGDATGSASYKPCANYKDYQVCNWMLPADSPDTLCRACTHNRTIPNLSVPGNKRLWGRLQTEKNRLIYSLLRLGLPLANKWQAPQQGLAFDFLGSANPRWREDSSVMTGHAQGLITLDIAEADDALREKVRQQMAEPYRTILGHFRHESGHYYWDRLIRNTDRLGACRECFGDESMDYGQALQRHYEDGPPDNWHASFISSYATSHPWEDWAETWAHYLHMIDTLETAWQFGLRLAPRVEQDDDLSTSTGFDPYLCPSFQTLADAWVPLTVALNSLNRSMGKADAYPFVLSPTIMQKLEFVHQVVKDNSAPDCAAGG